MKKKQKPMTDEEAEKFEREWREETFHGPAITSKTSMGHLRTTKFTMNKEPTK